MSNIRQIARLAGVSRTTVSRALRDEPTVTAQTREKVKEIARQLNYTPAHQSVRFPSGRPVIGYLIHNHFGVIATNILRGATEEARQASIGLLIMQVGPETTWIEESIHSLVDMGISGLVLSHSHRELLPRRILLSLRSRGIHVVQIMKQQFDEPLDTVCRREDDYARLAAAHLAHVGHRHVLGLGLERQDLWEEQIHAQGITAEFIYPALGAAAMQQSFQTFVQMTPRPTACIVSMDIDAYQFATYARLHGLAVPGDLSILGMGNFGENWFFDLSTIDIQSEEMGRIGIRLLAGRIADGIPPHEITDFHNIVLPPRIIDRGSIGPVAVPNPRH